MRWEDDSDPGDRGRRPDDEPFYTFGLNSLLGPVAWIGLLGGPILILWGVTWLTLAEPLGIVLVLLGLALLAWTVWRVWTTYRAWRSRRREG